MFMNHRLKGYLGRSQELFFNTQSLGIRTTQKAIQSCQGCHSHHRPSGQRPGAGAVSKGEATSLVQAGQDASSSASGVEPPQRAGARAVPSGA